MSVPFSKGTSSSKSRKKEIVRHEGNLRLLRSEADRLDEAILDLRVSLGKHFSGSACDATNDKSGSQSEEETMQPILQRQNSAAAVLCQVTLHHPFLASKLSFTKDVIGVVATLATVDNDNLSRLLFKTTEVMLQVATFALAEPFTKSDRMLSEFLGTETMLGIVCRTLAGVKDLGTYGTEGSGSTGLYGLASSIGRKIDNRFLAICLADLRPYVGEFIDDGPQKKFALPKPKLSNGMCPSGFLDFAVNMVNLDGYNLSFVTAGGRGLRETLFYNLFSHLQVYSTRADMLRALPCITHGALSLDGGIIREPGVFLLGNRKVVEVKFPVVSCTSKLAAVNDEVEERIKKLKWERLNISEDIRREEQLLEKAKRSLDETSRKP